MQIDLDSLLSAIEPEQIQKIRLSEILASLSVALDLTEGQPAGHSARSCIIGMGLAEQLQLGGTERRDLFYALLLKDAGCSSNAAKMAYLFGADDRGLKRDIKTIDWSRMLSGMTYAFTHVLPGSKPLERIMRFAALAAQGPQGAKKLIEIRCERGAEIARGLGFPEGTARAILDLDEHWNGHGHPLGLKRNEISLGGRILGIAQTVEVFWREEGRTAALKIAKARSGTWFDPAISKAFATLLRNEEFAKQVEDPDPCSIVSRFEPTEEVRYATEADLDRIALAFASVVDAKSPWTYRHSQGVAEIAVGIAGEMGVSGRRLRDLRRTALLHDLGKLGVSNVILDKPGRLTEEEIACMRRHPEYSEKILGQAACFSHFAAITGAHHERVDGKGYHRGVPSWQLPVEARILTVADVFEALTASRPYREGIPVEKVLEIFQKDSGTAFCPDAHAGLISWIAKRDFTSRAAAQKQALERILDELDICPDGRCSAGANVPLAAAGV